MSNGEIEIAVEIKIITPKGGVLVNNGIKDAWLSKAVISDYTDELEAGAHITIFIAEWIAEEKGLV